MNIAKIINFDTGNARGLSVVVFVSGCTHACYHCHNPETWDFNYGNSLEENMPEIKKILKNSHIKNLVISGGDPLNPKNIQGTYTLLKEVEPIIKENSILVILYTGYIMDELRERKTEVGKIFEYVDVVIDGRYDENLKTKSLDYRGSTNQNAWIKRNGKLYKDNSYFKEEAI